MKLKKLKIRKVLLTMFIVLPAGSVYAVDNTFIATDGNTYTWTVNTDGTNTATITGVSNLTNTASIIPSQVVQNGNTFTITEIGNEAFNGKAIASASFPSTLTKIQTHAFLECTALTSITIPSNVTYIGIAAFRGCTKVQTITIDASPALQIDYAAFCTDNINSLTGNIISKGSLKNVFFTTTTPPLLVEGTASFVEGTAPYFPSTAKIFVPDATEGTATTSLQNKYKQALSAYSSQIYKYFDKPLSGPFNDGSGTDFYYGTLALPYSVEIPSDILGVFTISGIKKNEGIAKATTTMIYSGLLPENPYLPAGTGVLLENFTAYTPRFLETTENVTAITGNKLHACLDEGGLTNDKISYLTFGRDKELLAQGQTVVGFYLYTGSKIACNTAYMLYSDAGAKIVTFSMEENTPTYINGIINESKPSQKKEVYDMQGRKVASPQKGIYIVNGKKVLY